MIRILVAIAILLNQPVFACEKDVQVLKQGEVAPCDGVFLSPDASKKADEAIQDAKYYKSLTDRLYQRQELAQKEVNILDERLKLYMEQSQTLSKELTSKQNEDKWQKMVYFSLGVLATGIAVYGAAQLNR